MSNALESKLEVWGFEDGLAIFSDSSFGFGFRIRPVDISCESDQTINQRKAQMKGFLSSLNSNIDIQFVQSIEMTEQSQLEEHLKYSQNNHPLIKTVRQARYEKFSNLNVRGMLPRQVNYVFVRIPCDYCNSISIKLFEFKFIRAKEKTEADFARALSQAKSQQLEIQRNLESSGFFPIELTPKEMTEQVFDSWNPGHPLGLGQFDESNIRERVILSDLIKDVRGFRLASQHHRVITLKILPEQTWSGMSQALCDLPFSSKLQLSIHVPDQQKEIEWLKLNRRMAFAMVVGKKGVSDIESEAKLQDIETLLSQIVKDGEKIFSTSLSIILRSEDEEELESQVSHALQVIRSLPGAEGYLESYASFDIFSQGSIPNARNKERSKKIISSNLADLLPVFGLWKGFEKPSVLLRTSEGSLFKFDPFSTTLTNANQIISGGSGSGKSYLTNLMIGQMLSQNPRVFILDVGGSYQKTCELLDGQYIPLSLSQGLSMNPFDRIEGDTVSDEKIKFLVALVQIMTKEDDQKSIGKLEKSEIERLIQAVYIEEIHPHLNHLRIKLLDSEIAEVKRIGKILSLWCEDSPFGKFIDRETNVHLNARVACFDLKGLEANPELQAVALFTITDFVWREVQKDRTEMKFLVFDECWRLLESDAGSQFVGEVFRTFRKYYASAIAISQNIDDFAKSKAASAIMPNSSIRWILKQSGADFKRLSEVLRLNDREVSLIQSLSQVKGQFSEAFLICEEKKAVVSVESTPFEYWLATTDPRDFALLKQTREKTNKEGLELIQHLSEQHPTGADSSSEGLN